LWWSFDYGPIHFVFISTEHNFTVGSEQWYWVKQGKNAFVVMKEAAFQLDIRSTDMESVDRSVTPWLIFAGHRPMFASSNHEDEVEYENYLREAYEPMFAAYDGEIYLSSQT